MLGLTSWGNKIGIYSPLTRQLEQQFCTVLAISYSIAHSSAWTWRLGQSDQYLLSFYLAARAAISYSIANISARTQWLRQSNWYLLFSYSVAGAAI